MTWGLGLLIAFLLLYLFWIEPRWLRICRYREPLAGLQSPLKVVVVSDLQPNSLHWPTSRLTKLFESLNREEPDLLLVLGDIYCGPSDAQNWFRQRFPKLHQRFLKLLPPIDDIAGALGHLKTKMGHVAVLGERDIAASEEEITTALERKGFDVINGDIIIVTNPETKDQVQLLGYGSREEVSRGSSWLHERLNRHVPTIGLSHNPDMFSRSQGGPGVILAGHTHGGQVRLPYLGAFVLPVENRRFDRGWFTEWGQRFFITSGMGTGVLPVRFLCPPEIVIIEFVPKK